MPQPARDPELQEDNMPQPARDPELQEMLYDLEDRGLPAYREWIQRFEAKIEAAQAQNHDNNDNDHAAYLQGLTAMLDALRDDLQSLQEAHEDEMLDSGNDSGNEDAMVDIDDNVEAYRLRFRIE